MTQARLLIEPSTLSLHTFSPATGNIALVLDGVVFPATGWNDFVLVILEAWITALVRLVRTNSVSERVYFMDGPYAVDMIRLERVFQLRALERPARERVIVEVPPHSLFDDAATAAEAVLHVCREAQHRSMDVERLENALTMLREERLVLRHGTPFRDS